MNNENLINTLVPTLFVIVIAALLLWIFWRNYVFTIKEDQRAVLIRLGRFAGVLGPGRVFILPLIDRLILISLSTIRSEFPIFSITTNDGVTTDLRMVISSRITDPESVVLKFENYLETMREFSQEFLAEEAGASIAIQFRSWVMYSSHNLEDDLAEMMRPFGVVVEGIEISIV